MCVFGLISKLQIPSEMMYYFWKLEFFGHHGDGAAIVSDEGELWHVVIIMSNPFLSAPSHTTKKEKD